MLTVKSIFILFCLALLGMGASGVYESITSGEMKPCVLAYFPMVYSQAFWLLFAQSIFNYIVVIVSLIGTPPGDILYFLLFVHFPMISSIIKSQLEELNQILDEPHASVIDVKQRLLDCFEMNRTFNGLVFLLS